MPSTSQSQLTFESGNKPIRLDAYLPDSPEKLPTVLALYGSGGGIAGMGEPATMLAAQGFAVFVLHYFDRTGTTQIVDRQTIFPGVLLWFGLLAVLAWASVPFSLSANREATSRLGERLCGMRLATSSSIGR